MSFDFRKVLEDLGVENPTLALSHFDLYYRLLNEWNKVMNLTTITEYDEVILKHFADSLSLAAYFDLNKVETVIDVGTGAGFPGIPLKIAFPNLKVTLLDSLNKRIKFLNIVIDELKLENIDAFHGRAEDFAKNGEFREQYDLCVSRAVANMAVLSEYCLPFVKQGGYFVPYKSGLIDEELGNAGNALKILGGSVEKTEKFDLYKSGNERSLVFVKKVKNTPKKYPRKSGLPSKEPL